MNRRVSWWLCVGVLGGLLGVLPSARAQSGDPADLEAPEWEEGEDYPAALDPVEPVQPEAESVPSEPQPEYQGPVGDDERMAPRPATAAEPASDEPAAPVSERRVEPFLFEVGAIGDRKSVV